MVSSAGAACWAWDSAEILAGGVRGWGLPKCMAQVFAGRVCLKAVGFDKRQPSSLSTGAAEITKPRALFAGRRKGSEIHMRVPCP
jgi:hypothetical protein